jgi:uroporphyrinogen III methyltransferase/synthase
MGLRNLERIASTLIARGKPAALPVAVVSWGATSRQKTVVGTLSTIGVLVRDSRMNPPAVIVIGEVVQLRGALNWYERRLLFGQRVVVTQQREQALPLLESLWELGADVLEVPVTRSRPPRDLEPIRRAVDRAGQYDWILFSHPLAVDFFLGHLLEARGDLRELGGARLCAYGPLTAKRLAHWHLKAAAVPADHTPALMLTAMRAVAPFEQRRVLLLRSESARLAIPEALRAAGAMVDDAACYAAEPEADDVSGDAERLVESGADWLVFNSGLAVDHFHARFNLPGLRSRFPGLRILAASRSSHERLGQLEIQADRTAASGREEDLLRALLSADGTGAV